MPWRRSAGAELGRVEEPHGDEFFMGENASSRTTAFTGANEPIACSRGLGCWAVKSLEPSRKSRQGPHPSPQQEPPVSEGCSACSPTANCWKR